MVQFCPQWFLRHTLATRIRPRDEVDISEYSALHLPGPDIHLDKHRQLCRPVVDSTAFLIIISKGGFPSCLYRPERSRSCVIPAFRNDHELVYKVIQLHSLRLRGSPGSFYQPHEIRRNRECLEQQTTP